MSGAGPHLLLSLGDHEGIRNVPLQSHEQDLLSGTSDKPEHHLEQVARGVVLSPAEDSAGEEPSEVSQERNVAHACLVLPDLSFDTLLFLSEPKKAGDHHIDRYRKTLSTTDIRRGKRKRVPTAKAQPGLDLWEQLHGNIEVSNKRRALTPGQTESSPDRRIDRTQVS